MKNVDKSISALKAALDNREKPETMSVSRLGDTLHLTAKRGKNGWRKWTDSSGKSYKNLDQALTQTPRSVEIKAEVLYDSPDSWEVFSDGIIYSSNEYDSIEQLLGTSLKGKRVELIGESRRAELLTWNMQVHRDFATNEVLRGNGRAELQDTLRKQNFYMDCECDEFKVLVCMKLDADNQTADGKIRSSWVVIDPGDPFIENANDVMFPKMEFDLSPAEVQACQETRLAFLYQGKLWAIRHEAKRSISNFFKLNVLFRDVIMDEALIGVGLSLAALMYDVLDEVRFFYRKTGHIFSIIAMTGCNYRENDTSREIFSALDYLRDNYGGIVANWNVSDDEIQTTVKFPVSTVDYQIFIRLELSDLPGRSVSAIAYAKVGKAKIAIRKSALSHTRKFMQMGGFQYILENRDNASHNNIFEAIAEFQEAFELLYSTTAVYSTAFLVPFTEYLGKRRLEEAEDKLSAHMRSGQAYAAIDLFREVLTVTHRANLDFIRFNIVSSLYADLFNRLIGKKAIDVNPKTKINTKKGQRKAKGI